MYADMESVFYYITTMNENYTQPSLPEGAREGILKGLYLLEDGAAKEYKVAGSTARNLRVRLLGSGSSSATGDSRSAR